jgi:hypothetical protein
MRTLNDLIRMTKAELAQLIEAYADSKASGNRYLVQKMIEELEQALDEVCGGTELPQPPLPPHDLPPLTPPTYPAPPHRPEEIPAMAGV